VIVRLATFWLSVLLSLVSQAGTNGWLPSARLVGHAATTAPDETAFGYDWSSTILKVVLASSATTGWIDSVQRERVWSDLRWSARRYEYDGRALGSVGVRREAAFTGHRFEEALGLTYAEQRWLDSSTGTFLSRDPVGPSSYLARPSELYAWGYAGGNPTRYVDADGRRPQTTEEQLEIGYWRSAAAKLEAEEALLQSQSPVRRYLTNSPIGTGPDVADAVEVLRRNIEQRERAIEAAADGVPVVEAAELGAFNFGGVAPYREIVLTDATSPSGQARLSLPRYPNWHAYSLVDSMASSPANGPFTAAVTAVAPFVAEIEARPTGQRAPEMARGAPLEPVRGSEPTPFVVGGGTSAPQVATASRPSVAAVRPMLGGPFSTPPEPRVDVSGRFRVRRLKRSVDLEYGNPEIHGIGVSVEDGVAGFDIRVRPGSEEHMGSGTDLVLGALKRLRSEGVAVQRLRGRWISRSDSVNAKEYLQNVRAGMSPETAAENTWTGRLFMRLGFRVESVSASSSMTEVMFVPAR
jgi:RHS repeat-associated protein